MKRLAGLALLAGLLLAGQAEAALTPDAAYGAYQAGHYRRALAEALKRIEADSSDAAAMTLLGELYRQGLGVPPDQKVATEWYERAETRGDINAAFALATQLLDEKSGKRDPARAGALLEKAAAAGHPPPTTISPSPCSRPTGRTRTSAPSPASKSRRRPGSATLCMRSACWPSRDAACRRARRLQPAG